MTKGNTGGLEVTFEFETTVELFEKTARREGLVSIMAEEFLSITDRIAKGYDKYFCTARESGIHDVLHTDMCVGNFRI